MSSKHPSDTELINELVKDFGKNQQKLYELVGKVISESQINLDPIAQSKLKLIRRSIMIEDIRNQELKIEMMTNVLKQICLPTVLPTA